MSHVGTPRVVSLPCLVWVSRHRPVRISARRFADKLATSSYIQTLPYPLLSTAWNMKGLTQNRACVIALLLPISDTAKQTLKLRPNQLYRTDSRNFFASTQNASSRRIVAKFDFSSIFGRRYLSFGSSRSVELRLTKAEGVSGCHFLLHLDPISGSLSLQDTSQSGTWIQKCPNGSWQLLQQSTCVLNGTCTIKLGSGADAVVFDLLIPVLDSARQHCRLLQEYQSSIASRTSSPAVARAFKRPFFQINKEARPSFAYGRRSSCINIPTRASTQTLRRASHDVISHRSSNLRHQRFSLSFITAKRGTGGHT